MDTDGVMQLFALLILVMLSAFFSSAETSLTTVNRVRLKALAEEGSKRAQTALDVLEKYGKMLSAILIGNNIVNLYASSQYAGRDSDRYLDGSHFDLRRDPAEECGYELFGKTGAWLCGGDRYADEGTYPGDFCCGQFGKRDHEAVTY